MLPIGCCNVPGCSIMNGITDIFIIKDVLFWLNCIL